MINNEKVLIYGPMFAGKSDKLIDFYLQKINSKSLIFKPKIDTRSSFITSRSGKSLQATEINSWEEIFEIVKENSIINSVFIDEAQFISLENFNFNEFIDYFDKNKINLYVSILDRDYLTNHFESFTKIKDVFSYEVIQSAICKQCGNIAFYTIKISKQKNNNNLIEIDNNSGNILYIPVCLKCHKIYSDYIKNS